MVELAGAVIPAVPSVSVDRIRGFICEVTFCSKENWGSVLAGLLVRPGSGDSDTPPREKMGVVLDVVKATADKEGSEVGPELRESD